MKPNELPADAAELHDPDALAEMIDRLFESGTQHINLEIGEQTGIRTVNSTDCGGKPGACAVPNFPYNDENSEEAE
ncbi:MAG: hypothetical protein IJ060_12095 [Oscillospiraceae bacterium]|nr:hypothetical protein [Oscillospiraceae bacterium]